MGICFTHHPEKVWATSIKSELKGMLEKWGETDKEEVLSWLDRFLEYNTYEIAIPAMRDSDLAPEGKTGWIVSLLMEAELFYKS